MPADAVMLLTVGSASKYEAMPGLDFLAAIREILKACPQAYLVAVGPKEEGVWKAARQATGGRILPLGYQQDSTLFCRSADLYLEGFPLGSLTALLEAGQAGLMCVRAPLESPLPFCSDSLSLDSISQPRDITDYINTAVALINDSPARIKGGLRLQRDIESQHCGAGWQARLREIRKEMPTVHQVRSDFRSVAASEALRDWYLKYNYRNASAPTWIGVATRIFIEAWKRVDSQPRLDARLWRELQSHGCGDGAESKHVPAAGSLSERFRLWRFNRRISSQGSRHRFMARANVAFRSGRAGLARRMIYKCIWASPTCWGDSRWLRQFVKVHLGPQLLTRFQGLVSRKKRQFAN